LPLFIIAIFVQYRYISTVYHCHICPITVHCHCLSLPYLSNNSKLPLSIIAIFVQ
jgi:hypothetical protein